jgi:hypothetical protein
LHLHRKALGCARSVFFESHAARIALRPGDAAEHIELASAHKKLCARLWEMATDQLRTARTNVLKEYRPGAIEGHGSSGYAYLPPRSAGAGPCACSLSKTRHHNDSWMSNTLLTTESSPTAGSFNRGLASVQN